MVTCFCVLTAAVVIAALLRSRKGKRTAKLIKVQMIALFIVSVFGIAFASSPVFSPITPPLGLEITAAVLQFAALIFALIKSNGSDEKNSAPTVKDQARMETDVKTADIQRQITIENAGENSGSAFEEQAQAEKDVNNANTQQQITAVIRQLFTLNYAPYLTENFKDTPRDFNDLPPLDIPERHVARAVDEQRAQRPYAGAELASKEIFLNLTKWLTNEKGVHAETLLAVLGSIGGRECCKGVMTALDEVADKLGQERLTPGALFALDIMIVDSNSGEKYLLGDRIASEFCSFYMTAAKDNTHPFEALKPISEKCASTGGTEDYWNTPFGEFVADSPKALADYFDGKFDVTFATYCRYPHERMMAVALAAQRAVSQAEGIVPKDKAMSILAEFGWRTSHYIGREL